MVRRVSYLLAVTQQDTAPAFQTRCTRLLGALKTTQGPRTFHAGCFSKDSESMRLAFMSTRLSRICAGGDPLGPGPVNDGWLPTWIWYLDGLWLRVPVVAQGVECFAGLLDRSLIWARTVTFLFVLRALERPSLAPDDLNETASLLRGPKRSSEQKAPYRFKSGDLRPTTVLTGILRCQPASWPGLTSPGE